MLSQLETLMVYVQDMPRAVAFYRYVLGLPMQMESPGWSQFDLGRGLSLGLHRAMAEVSETRPTWVPGFHVDDVRAAKARLQAADAPIVGDFHDIPGGVVLEFADPDGNHIDIAQMGVSCADLGVAAH